MNINTGHCLDVAHGKILCYRLVIKYTRSNPFSVYVKTECRLDIVPACMINNNAALLIFIHLFDNHTDIRNYRNVPYILYIFELHHG